MAINAVQPCDDQLLDLAYFIFLGRKADPQNAWIGAPLSEVVCGLLASDEFKNIAHSISNLNFSSPTGQRPRGVRAALAKDLEDRGAPAPRSASWYDLLRSGLTWVTPLLTEHPAAELINEVRSVLESAALFPVDVDDLLASLLVFDPLWFRMANKGAPGLMWVDDADLEEYAAQAAVNGIAEVTPFFPLSGKEYRALRRAVFGEVDKASKLSLQEVMARLSLAAKNGVVGHWLFHPATYLSDREKAFATNLAAVWRPLDVPYLDFLANGDRASLRPHPLFSPVSYREFNCDVEHRSAFDHYLRAGQFLEARTSALFDPEFYYVMNPSVLLDVAEGRFGTALESFCKEGAENGWAFSPDFDADFYSRTFSDVAEVVSEGTMSPQQHFIYEGLTQERSPNPYFDPQYYVQRYPDVAAICQTSRLSALEQFLLFGRLERRHPSKPLVDREIDSSQAKAIYERRALESLNRVTAQPLDFGEFAGANPILSVVVPVHNQISFTARFLEQAHHACAQLKRRLNAYCEIIVVSNGSSDGTDDLLQTFSGLKTVLSADAIGYPRAVNEGAKVATGNYLLIANNDIEFDPGIFAEIVATFGGTPNCGALGPLILSLDMTVQEGGSFIAKDGSTAGYGRGMRSTFLSDRGLSSVDYVSGCFLCVGRSDFEGLGGFDEVFSPGYYEEVDLCLRIQEKLGKKVMIDTRLSICHYENASFLKGRPPAVSHPIILRNRRKIRQKHPGIGDRLSTRQLLGAGRHGQVVARKSRLLVVTDQIPDARLGSETAPTALLLRTFYELGVSFDILALNSTPEIDEYEFRDVRVYRAWMPLESLDQVLATDVATYSHLWVCNAQNLNKATAYRAYKERHGATILAETSTAFVEATVENGRTIEKADVVLDRIGMILGGNIADKLIAPSERDADLVRAAGYKGVSVIAPSASTLLVGNKTFAERDSILFLGAIPAQHPRNFEILVWFAKFVMPKIEHLEKKLTVVGVEREAIEWLKPFMAIDRVEFTAVVSDKILAQLCSRASVAVAPTQQVPNISAQVIEVMRSGTPVVTSTAPRDEVGLTAREAQSLAAAPVGDDGVAFADAIATLVKDQNTWTRERAAQMAHAGTRRDGMEFRRQVCAVLDQAGVVARGITTGSD